MVSQRSIGWGANPDDRRRADVARLNPNDADPDPEPEDWPPELRRCTCGTRSFEAADHAIGCRLATHPPNASHGW